MTEREKKERFCVGMIVLRKTKKVKINEDRMRYGPRHTYCE